MNRININAVIVQGCIFAILYLALGPIWAFGVIGTLNLLFCFTK